MRLVRTGANLTSTSFTRSAGIAPLATQAAATHGVLFKVEEFSILPSLKNCSQRAGLPAFRTVAFFQIQIPSRIHSLTIALGKDRTVSAGPWSQSFL